MEHLEYGAARKHFSLEELVVGASPCLKLSTSSLPKGNIDKVVLFSSSIELINSPPVVDSENPMGRMGIVGDVSS